MQQYLLIFLLFWILPSVGFAQTDAPRIMFFGDSITAGMGVDEDDAFPALVQTKIDDKEKNAEVINAGNSGETSAGGLRRVDWMLQQHVDIFVLELGGNDGLRGVDLESTEQNLQDIIDKVKEQYPEAKIIIAGMEVPPNLGMDYTQKFREMYPRLAEKNEAELIPFLLEGVGGEDEYMQGDGIHPNEKGHEKIADTVWETLEPMLQNIQ